MLINLESNHWGSGRLAIPGGLMYSNTKWVIRIWPKGVGGSCFGVKYEYYVLLIFEGHQPHWPAH
jgi:hypothetical protein